MVAQWGLDTSCQNTITLLITGEVLHWPLVTPDGGQWSVGPLNIDAMYFIRNITNVRGPTGQFKKLLASGHRAWGQGDYSVLWVADNPLLSQVLIYCDMLWYIVIYWRMMSLADVLCPSCWHLSSSIRCQGETFYNWKPLLLSLLIYMRWTRFWFILPSGL